MLPHYRLCLFASALFWAATSLSAQEVRLIAPTADADLRDRLHTTALLTQQAGDAGRSTQDILAAARADYGRLTAALYDEGHFSPIVRITLDGREAAAISPFDTPTAIRLVEIRVDPGPAFTFGEASIAPLAPGTVLPPGFAPGAPASTPILRDATAAALEGWRAAGHATADVGGQQITARNPNAVLDARIRITPGPLVTLGRLQPEGEDLMRPERIVEIAALPEGLVYSPEAIARAEERLRDSGVFSSVALEETALRDGAIMDITASVLEAPLRRLGFGAEVSTSEGAQLTAYWMHRNLMGGGERGRFSVAITGIGRQEISTDTITGTDFEVEARFSRPATFTPDTTAYAEAGAYYLEEPSFTIGAAVLELGVEHRFDDNLDGALGIALYALDIDDGFGQQEIGYLLLPGEVAWDNRDDPLDPSAGVYFFGSLDPFLSFDQDAGARATLDARGYLSLDEAGQTRLAARAQLGSVFGADIDAVPPDFLFFSGGSGTVRGQEYQSLGGTYDGIEAGARGFAGLSAEIRQGIGDTNFGIVAFADAGAVSSDALLQDDVSWHAGAGLGLRYSTPFGPVRVDLATPVHSNGVGEDVFLYIGIGQSF